MPKPKSEHALAIIKAGVSAVSVMGGSIASLIGDYVPTATGRSIETAIDLLRKKLEDPEDRIDPDAVNKDEFVELFKSCYLSIVRTGQKNKLHAATGLIANILLKEGDPENLSYTELDHYARCVDALSIGAIEVVGHTLDIAGQSSTKDIESRSFRFSFEQIQKRMPGAAPSLLMGLVGELNALNLVHLPGVPPIRTADYGNYPIELTPLGTKFVLRLLQLSE